MSVEQLNLVENVGSLISAEEKERSEARKFWKRLYGEIDEVLYYKPASVNSLKGVLGGYKKWFSEQNTPIDPRDKRDMVMDHVSQTFGEDHDVSFFMRSLTEDVDQPEMDRHSRFIKETVDEIVADGLFAEQPLRSSAPDLPVDCRYAYPRKLLEMPYDGSFLSVMIIQQSGVDVPQALVKYFRENIRDANEIIMKDIYLREFFHRQVSDDSIFDLDGYWSEVKFPRISSGIEYGSPRPTKNRRHLSYNTNIDQRKIRDLNLYTDQELAGSVKFLA